MGALSTFRDSVTLVNRTNREVSVRYDGEDITLKPGENPGFPLVAVSFAKRQNILMGSRHPLNPARAIYLIGVKGTDNCEPIPAETLAKADAALEALDRDGEHWGDPMDHQIGKTMKVGRKRGFDPFEAQTSMPAEYDVNRNIE